MSRFKEKSSKIEGRFDRKSVSLSKIDYVFVKNKRKYRYRRIHKVKEGTAGK